MDKDLHSWQDLKNCFCSSDGQWASELIQMTESSNWMN